MPAIDTSDCVLAALGGLGFAMPQAGMQHGIEESVWYDPHVGGDHGFVEWVRVVVDEQTLVATAEGPYSEERFHELATVFWVYCVTYVLAGAGTGSGMEVRLRARILL